MTQESKSARVVDDQLLRISDVVSLTTLSKSSIKLWVATGRFPKPIPISKTLNVWRMGEIRNWINQMEGGCSHD